MQQIAETMQQIAEVMRKLERIKELDAALVRLQKWMATMPDLGVLEVATGVTWSAETTSKVVADATGAPAKFSGFKRGELVLLALHTSGESTVADLARFLQNAGYTINKKAVNNALYAAEKAGKAKRREVKSNGRNVWAAGDLQISGNPFTLPDPEQG